MITPKEIYKKFYNELKKKKSSYGNGFNKFLCGETGFSSGYISSVVNGKQEPSQDAQIKIANACRIDYQSLITADGEEKQPAPKKYTIEIDDQETWQHFKVIKRFKNKGIALEMNERLADFEEYDQWKFLKLLNKIDEFIEEIKAQDKDQGNKTG